MREGWQTVQLSNLLTKRTDFTPIEDGVSYRCAGVQRSGWGIIERDPFVGGISKFTKLMRLETDNFVYRVITAFEAPSAVVDDDSDGMYVSPQTFPVFTVNKAQILPAYLKLLTTAPSFHHEMAARCTGSVLRRMTLSVGALLSIPINLPPLEEQQRIVDLIGALDEAIEAADGAAQKSQVALFELSETLPKVETVNLGSLATMRSGPSWGAADESDVPRTGFEPVLAITNTRPAGDIDLSAQRFVKGLSEKVMRLTDDSIVMIRTNGNRSRIGNVYRSDSSVLGFAVSAFQIAIEPLSSCDSDFLFWVLSTPAMQALISNSASGSTGLGNVAIGWLKELDVPFPNEESVREEFVSLCRVANDNVLASRSLATSLSTLRSELLTVLLSGEHEIPESYDASLTPASSLEPAA